MAGRGFGSDGALIDLKMLEGCPQEGEKVAGFLAQAFHVGEFGAGGGDFGLGAGEIDFGDGPGLELVFEEIPPLLAQFDGAAECVETSAS
jgi:hypothetical protein